MADREPTLMPETDIEVLRRVAQRLCDAIADRAAVNPGSVGWKEVMDAEDEELAALKALRTAIDGRPR